MSQIIRLILNCMYMIQGNSSKNLCEKYLPHLCYTISQVIRLILNSTACTRSGGNPAEVKIVGVTVISAESLELHVARNQVDCELYVHKLGEILLNSSVGDICTISGKSCLAYNQGN